MLCQKCGLSEATVHRQTVVYRQRIEEHLCPICAGVGIVLPAEGEAAGVSGVRFARSQLDLDVPPDPKRTRELRLPTTIAVHELSDLLRIKPFKAIAILMSFGLFASMRQSIDFKMAARLCEHCGVKARRRDEPTA